MRRELVAAATAALALAALPAVAVAVAALDSQRATLRNDALTSSDADAGNAGAALDGGTIATGQARSYALPLQRIANRQRIAGARACPPGRCAQEAEVTNAGTLASAADASNTGGAIAGAQIVTGAATSHLRLDQDGANHQEIAGTRACAPGACAQRATVRNGARLTSLADTHNAADAAAAAAIVTPAATVRVLVEQSAAGRQLTESGRPCPPAGCWQPARVTNDATVTSRAARAANRRAAPATRITAGDADSGNVARLEQAGLDNRAVVQQTGRHVEQSAARNAVHSVIRQTIILRRGRAPLTRVEAWTSTHDAVLHALSGSRPSPPAAGAGCPSGACPGGPARGAALAIEQHAVANVALVQQAAQRVRQSGARNVALIELVQVIVVPRRWRRPTLPAAGVSERTVVSSCGWRGAARCTQVVHAGHTTVTRCSGGLAAVQQARHTIRQVGSTNVARIVARVIVRSRGRAGRAAASRHRSLCQRSRPSA